MFSIVIVEMHRCRTFCKTKIPVTIIAVAYCSVSKYTESSHAWSIDDNDIEENTTLLYSVFF